MQSSDSLSKISVVWHRRDLRLDDHPALYAASQQSEIVIGIFIFDPAILHSHETGGGKVDFMLGCLQELQASYQALGSELLFFYGEPITVMRNLAQTLPVKYVFFNRDVEPLARQRDREVQSALKEVGVEANGFIDISLHDPRAITTQGNLPYKVYTPFWRNWISKPKPLPVDKPARLVGLSESERDRIQPSTIPLPTLVELKFSHEQTLPAPGEAIAQKLLTEFCDSQKLLRYKESRDFPALAGTSHLSPHLRFGTVGIRRVWSAIENAKPQIRSEEERLSLQTWQQELAWREFYQHVLYHFPELATNAYRAQMQIFEWDDHQAHFEAWCAGKTGFPIVDAAMRQLNQMGWMHNRCRMIVASFLTKDLLINWQKGELYFMQNLVDGDLTANNGGWQWSASSGMDPKPLRIFNPSTQASKYDPEGEYILHWLPELRGLTKAELLSGNIPAHQCQKRGYPLPIVDHNEQQRIFKQRYQLAKA